MPQRPISHTRCIPYQTVTLQDTKKSTLLHMVNGPAVALRSGFQASINH